LLLQTFRLDIGKATLKLKTGDKNTSKAVSWFSDDYEIANSET
jgi:hypothetical protein